MPNLPTTPVTPTTSSRPPLSPRLVSGSAPSRTDTLPAALDEAQLAAKIEQMANDVVEAECEQMKLKKASDKAGMIGKENLHRNGKPVYAPVRQFLMAEFKSSAAFLAEVKKQGALLEEAHGKNPDALRVASGNESSGGKAAKVDQALLDPYNKPIFRIVCGERFDYGDCSLGPRAKRLLETIDAKLHAKLLEDKSLSLRDTEKIRANLFKGILFTRGISVFLLNPNGDEDADAPKTPPRVFQNWSAAANRSFNLDYKEFAKSFVRYGNAHLPEAAQKAYKAKQQELRAERTRQLKEGKRSANPRARSQPLLPQGEDFKRAMKAEARRHREEQASGRDGDGDHAIDETIASYRELYAKNWTGAQARQFKSFFDARIASWKTSQDSSDVEALEKELKAILRAYKAELKKTASSSSTASSSTTSSTANASDTGSGEVPLSPRTGKREQHGLAETAKRQRQRQEAFAKALKAFLADPDCAMDFADDAFAKEFEAAAWKAFDPERSRQDIPAQLRQVFEEGLLAHFKRGVVAATESDAVAGSHPRFRQLDAMVAAWKGQAGGSKLLSGAVLSGIWMRMDRDAMELMKFKTALSETDKAAIARFAALDAAHAKWRMTPDNLGKPLTDAVLKRLWAEGSPKKSDAQTEPRGASPQSLRSEEEMKRDAHKRARVRMHEQLKSFIEDPANVDFARERFMHAFLDNAIERQGQLGMSALQPEKLKALYTATQVQRFWESRRDAGWSDAARDELTRRVYARCAERRSHVASEEDLRTCWRYAMAIAFGKMLDDFLRDKASWKAMAPDAQAAFRQEMAEFIGNWIKGGAPGSVPELFLSTYQDRLIDRFVEEKRAEGRIQQAGLLRLHAMDWRKQHAGAVLETDILEQIWQGLPDMSFLDELVKHAD